MGVFSDLIAETGFQSPFGQELQDAEKTRTQLGVIDRTRQQFAPLRDRFTADVGTIGDEQRTLRSAANQASFLNLKQNPGNTRGGVVDNALRSAGARQGIVNRGDAAIRNQRLKDRLQIVRSGLSRRGAALDLQGAGQQIRAGVNIQRGEARDAGAAARSSAVGGGLGALAGVLGNNLQDNDSLFDFGKKGPGIFGT